MHERLHWFDGAMTGRGIVLIHRLLLLIDREWVLRDKLFASHAEAREKKVCLDGGDHVIFLFRDQITCLHLEILLVLALSLLNVVAEGLLLDAGANHFLLVLSELLIGHWWVSVVFHVVTVSLFLIVMLGSVAFLEVLGVSEGGSAVKVSLQGSLHVW